MHLSTLSVSSSKIQIFTLALFQVISPFWVTIGEGTAEIHGRRLGAAAELLAQTFQAKLFTLVQLLFSDVVKRILDVH